MLQKVIKVRNIGCFGDYSARQVPQWTRYTLICADNGHGKSTLSAILRSLAEGEPQLLLGRRRLGVDGDPLVELLFSTSTSPVSFDQGAWNQDLRSISIFDNVFVDRNVHSGESVSVENRRNLYQVIVGSQGVELAREDNDLAAQSRRLTERITDARNALQPLVPHGITLDAFLELEEIPDVDGKVQAQQGVLSAMTAADEVLQLPLLPTLETPTLPEAFLDRLSTTLDTIATDAEAALAEHLTAHGFGQTGPSWVEEGLAHTQSDRCPFCGRSIQGLPLIEAYRAIFSEEYQAFQNSLSDLAIEVEEALGQPALRRLLTYTGALGRSVESWGRFLDLSHIQVALPEDVSDVLNGMVGACRLLLEHKQASPAELVEPDEDFLQAYDNFTRLRGKLEELTSAVVAANEDIAQRKSEAATPAIQSAQAELNRLVASKTRYTAPAIELVESYRQLQDEKAAVEAEKERVRAQLSDHTTSVVEPLENRVNELLTAFNASFQIANTSHRYPGGRAASSYRLVINGTPIEIGDSGTSETEPRFGNTLSAGDRMTLALAFFIASLEREPDLHDRIVVFDDPFGSQDSFRRRQTAFEILRMGRICKQVIVLSHDPNFLRDIWERTEGAERTALCIPTSDTGSKIEVFDLKGATSSRYLVDINKLQGFRTLNEGDSWEIARLLRTTFETYCRFRFPLTFGPDDNLGQMISKTRIGGADHPAADLIGEMEVIYDYVDAHHGDNLARLGPVELNRSELRGCVERLLQVLHGKRG